MKTEKSRNDLLKEFEEAPKNALFNQTTVAALRNCSIATIERDRWAGSGIPFLRITPRCIRYYKKDILAWLNTQRRLSSTAQADALKS